MAHPKLRNIHNDWLLYSFIVFLTIGAHWTHTMIFNKKKTLPKSFYDAFHTYLSLDIQLISIFIAQNPTQPGLHSLMFTNQLYLSSTQNSLHIYIFTIGLSLLECG